jgi:hypothetical protein
MEEEFITIQITRNQWQKLNTMKFAGETFVNVLERILKTSQRTSLGSIKKEVTGK